MPAFKVLSLPVDVNKRPVPFLQKKSLYKSVLNRRVVAQAFNDKRIAVIVSVLFYLFLFCRSGCSFFWFFLFLRF